MANNLFADVPAAVVARETVSFATAGITALNTRIIYEVGSPLKSYVPGRSINAISGFTAEKGYYIIPAANMDLSDILIPPINISGGSADVTPPTVTSTTLTDATHITRVFSEVINGTNSGYSFKKAGANWPIASVTGFGSNTLIYTMTGAAVAGNALSGSYDPTTGDTVDTATPTPNELAAFTDVAFTNSLGAAVHDTTNMVAGYRRNSIQHSGGTVTAWTNVAGNANYDFLTYLSPGDPLYSATDGVHAAGGQNLSFKENPGTPGLPYKLDLGENFTIFFLGKTAIADKSSILPPSDGGSNYGLVVLAASAYFAPGGGQYAENTSGGVNLQAGFVPLALTWDGHTPKLYNASGLVGGFNTDSISLHNFIFNLLFGVADAVPDMYLRGLNFHSVVMNAGKIATELPLFQTWAEAA